MKYLIIIFIVFSFLFSDFAYSQRGGPPQSSGPVQIGLGAISTSNTLYRGALVWDKPLFVIGPSFTFFNKIRFGAGGLTYFNQVSPTQRVSIGVRYFDDNEPEGPIFKLIGDGEDFKNQRPSTYGTNLRYDFNLRPWIGFGLHYSKDLGRHYGEYFSYKVTTSVIPFITLGYVQAYGDRPSLRYTYGPESVSGKAHSNRFIRAVYPSLPGGGRLLLTYTETEINLEENYEADYIRGNRRNFNTTLMAMWAL